MEQKQNIATQLYNTLADRANSLANQASQLYKNLKKGPQDTGLVYARKVTSSEKEMLKSAKPILRNPDGSLKIGLPSNKKLGNALGYALMLPIAFSGIGCGDKNGSGTVTPPPTTNPTAAKLVFQVTDYERTSITKGTDGYFNIGVKNSAINVSNPAKIYLLTRDETGPSYVPEGSKLSLITTPGNGNGLFYSDPVAINGVINNNNEISIDATSPMTGSIRLEMQTDGGLGHPDYRQTELFRIFGVQLPPNFQDIIQNTSANITNQIETPTVYGFTVSQLENLLEGNLDDMSTAQRPHAITFRASAPSDLQTYLLNTLRDNDLTTLLFDRASKVYHDANTKLLWVPTESDQSGTGMDLSVAAPTGVASQYIFLRHLLQKDATNDALFFWNHN